MTRRYVYHEVLTFVPNVHEKNFDMEDEGVELARASERFKNCKHELETRIRKELTFDAREIKKQITTCKHCSYYKVVVDATLTSLETYICPFCLGLDLCEVEETQLWIESIVSVRIAEADALIKQGYEVKDTYANTVTLVKRAKEEK